MGIIMWLVVGGIIGWLASVVMRTNGQQGIILNLIVGIVGAFIGGLLLARGDINDAPLNVMTFAASLCGAVLLLGIVNLIRRGSAR
ncbi:GlsB/YeaQ/YmgE family stress response membrane protein [Sphingomonas quercus]|uniref:GlsB/YeaQ/YmgE family stress response membrane protein n=1 Tax=Sphingomonas quercus TaxID=2842451 RepID=A0ABS6BKB8_9SPHN|nr:GlsB/YeaQ/YmgE family stress response membrane protein [Sphingomonas quercus]MBU3077665.1 GlsB/YeaQ/YmgE family stress response membrane protein [Sphingomonas quercus]